MDYPADRTQKSFDFTGKEADTGHRDLARTIHALQSVRTQNGLKSTPSDHSVTPAFLEMLARDISLTKEKTPSQTSLGITCP